jgi:hypothetical protein
MTIEALRRAEQKYRSIFEHAREAFFKRPGRQVSQRQSGPCPNVWLRFPEDLLADLGRQLYVESDRRRKLR